MGINKNLKPKWKAYLTKHYKPFDAEADSS